MRRLAGRASVVMAAGGRAARPANGRLMTDAETCVYTKCAINISRRDYANATRRRERYATAATLMMVTM